MLHGQLIIFLATSGVVAATALAAKPLIEMWLGSDIDVSNDLILAMSLLVIVSTWNNVFGVILGGLGKIRLGSIYTIATAIVNLPISYYFSKILEFGIAGVVLGSIVSILISSVLSPIQVYYFIYTKVKSERLNKLLR